MKNILWIVLTLSVCEGFSVSTESRAKAATVEELQARSDRAKLTWQTVALTPTNEDARRVDVDLKTEAQVFDADRFADFLTVRGTYFINGLASCQLGEQKVHPFESHGFVKSLAFQNGKLRFQSAIVQTPLARRERSAQKLLERGVMNTVAPFDFPRCLLNAISSSERDTANLTAELWPQDPKANVKPVLIVGGDNGTPFAVDPATLETLGPLTEVVPSLRELRGLKFLAHKRIEGDRMIFCASKFDIPGEDFQGNTQIEFIEVDSNFEVVSRRSQTARFMVFHDWMITPDYYIVPQNPAVMKYDKLAKFVVGQTVGVDIFEMDVEANGAFWLIPRHDPEAKAQLIEADSHFSIFHFGPCSQKDDLVTIYASVFDDYEYGGEMGFDGVKQEFDPIRWSSNERIPAPRLDKFVLDLSRGSLVNRERLPVLDEIRKEDVPIDMPTFGDDGTNCQFSYFIGACRPEGWFPFRSVVKRDLWNNKTWNWDAGDDKVVSEVMFVPRDDGKSEDDGFVLGIVHDSTKQVCDMMVWDSTVFGDGPMASIPLGGLMPWCVHGSWAPNYIAEQ